MKSTVLPISGWGIYSDQFANAAALVDAVRPMLKVGNTSVSERYMLPPMEADSALETALRTLDPVNQYAIRAVREAWHNAKLDPRNKSNDRTALVLLTSWGPMENASGFLDSMFESGGRYASPRYFTRSVYSTVAAHAAIHFGIHGPCESLVHGDWPICSVLDRAADILESGSADQVMVCWVDQHSDMVVDLCKRAASGLGRKEMIRFTRCDSGCGAVALVLERVDVDVASRVTLELLPRKIQEGREPYFFPSLNIHPYPTDGAVYLAAVIAAAQLAVNQEPLLWTEAGPRHRNRVVCIR